MIKNEFHLSRNAPQTPPNINDLDGVNTTNERFRHGNFNLKNKATVARKLKSTKTN